MSEPHPEPTAAKPRASGSTRAALVLAVLALAATAAQWVTGAGRGGDERARIEEIAKTQRRINALENRMQRDRADLDRLAQRVGNASGSEESLSGRMARLEEAFARQPGGERVRLAWLIEQAEYFMRIANAQENLAGNTAGALAALAIADEYLRDAADPRLGAVRKLVAEEIAALRAVPRVDVEGLALKIGALGDSLDRLPRRQAAPAGFAPPPPEPAPAASAGERLMQSLRAALSNIIVVRRTDEPTATLLSEEAADLLIRSLELELQLSRLALLRGEAAAYRAALGNVRGSLERYFDGGSAEVAAAIALLEELAAVPMPETLPDISGSLTELLRIKASGQAS